MPRALPRKKQKAVIRSRSTERLRRIFPSRPQNLKFQMKSRFSRAATAIGIGASLWFGSIAALATPQQPQPQTKDQTTAQDQSTSPTDQKNQKSGTQAPQQTAANKKPLSTNDDPAMIGKRNINKGIWGKMAAGTEKEVREGRMLAAQVDKEAKFIDDPIITEYVNRVGQNIVLHSDAKVPFTIKVIDSDEVNAFALPGGFFYVNKGLILAADNEAELAGVMAHETGHVAARHAMENERKMQVIDYGMLAGTFPCGGVIRDRLCKCCRVFENPDRVGPSIRRRRERRHGAPGLPGCEGALPRASEYTHRGTERSPKPQNHKPPTANAPPRAATATLAITTTIVGGRAQDHE